MTEPDGNIERAEIEAVRLDEERGFAVCVMLRGPGWGQGFASILCKDAQERGDFVRSICAVFGCSTDELVGQPCVARRCFGLLGEIEGLTSVKTGRTFTLTAWRKRQGYPAYTPLEAALQRREREIGFLKRRLADEEASFDRLLATYTPVDGEAP